MISPIQEARHNKLFKLGLKFNGDSFIYQDINFHWTDTLCMTDIEFDKAFEGAVKRKAVIAKMDRYNTMETGPKLNHGGPGYGNSAQQPNG